MNDEQIRKMVREGYAQRAKTDSSCCGSSCDCGCGPTVEDVSLAMGYTDADLKAVPEGANLGLGCGNPVALASLKEGETVLDLGSGAGIDCFLAAQRVGPKGRVIGVDMTPEMLQRARDNARKGGYANVEFRLGEIEHLPVADGSVDAIISNCVINLSPDKPATFREAYRALRPGGRLMVSDIVLLGDLPDAVRKSVEAYVGCVAGASLKDDYLDAIHTAGFQTVRIVEETPLEVDGQPDIQAASVKVEGRKVV
jgi:arsenite methyltransferase